MFPFLRLRKFIGAGFIFAVGCLLVAALQAEDITLKDGRVLNDASIHSQSALSVMIKHRDGVSSIAKNLLPDNLAAQYPVDQKALEKTAAEKKTKETSRAKTKEAAAAGDPTAQFALGNIYFTGDGVPKDFGEATKWYRQAAEQGIEGAQYKLARMCDTGEGLPRDFHEAAKWYKKSAEQGNSDAQANLGRLYQKGMGVTQDNFEAAKWIRMAAEQGNVACQKQMVSFFLAGDGVPKDDLEALAWMSVAAASGDFESKQLRERLEAAGRRNPNLLLYVQQRSSEIFKMIAANKTQKTNLIPKSTIAPPEAATAKGNGSGVIISTSGYVLTAAHVVAKASKVVVVTAQGSKSARVIQSDDSNDVAILKLESGTYPALPVIPSRQVRLGQMVATIGFPIVNVQGFSPKVTRGEISSINGAGDDPKRWQISAPVQPGNSGGPLLDENGNIVGIVVSKLTGESIQNVNYAIKSTYALGLIEPYLGDNAPKANAATPPQRFEDMIATAQQSVVLILVY